MSSDEKKETRKSTIFTGTADKADAYLNSIGRGGEKASSRSTTKQSRNKYGRTSGGHPMARGSRSS